MLKTNLEWIKKHAATDMKVWMGMVKDFDWEHVKKVYGTYYKRDWERIVGEFKAFKALSPAENARRHKKRIPFF